MGYIVDYSIASTIYLTAIIWFYIRQKHIPGIQNTLFKWMLFVGMAALILDVFVALVDNWGWSGSVAVLYAINIVFLFFSQMCPALFFVYVAVITGYYSKFKSWQKAVLALPIFSVIFALILSPFSQFSIFYFDDNFKYCRGSVHILLLISAVIYSVGSLIMVFTSRNNTNKEKKIAIYFFICVSLVAMIIQRLDSDYLVTQTAFALSLVIIYYALESPKDHLDPLTGAYNSTGCRLIIKDLYSKGEVFSVMMVAPKNLRNINQQFGRGVGDIILIKIYEAVCAKCPNGVVSRISGEEFCVIMNHNMINKQKLQDFQQSFPKSIDIGNGMVNVGLKVAGIYSGDCARSNNMFLAMDYITQIFRSKSSELVIMADKAFHETCNRRQAEILALENALDTNSVEVYYQPIHKTGDKVIVLEALARIRDEKMGFISPDTFIRLAEQNGSIMQLGRQVLDKVAAFIATGVLEKYGLDHISVNLSAAQFMEENICEDLIETVDRHSVAHEKIWFEITETEAAESMELVKKTMDTLSEAGFKFSLDDFGTGYANFSYIFQLPFNNVKLDKSLLWDAIDDSRKKRLFKSIVSAIKGLELSCICEGVENEEHISLLKHLNINLHQGFFYSKPLPANTLLQYLEQEKNNR